jgi:protein arginine kinase activator
MVNDQTLKLHLCESCAKKKGMIFPFGKEIFSLGEMVAGLAKSSPLQSTLFSTRCQRCGLTYPEFKQTSQLGCSQCYATFASVLEPLLKKIHGGTQHVGKTSMPTVRTLQPIQELAQLKLDLREAIKTEAFEKAAAIRDHIRSLEQAMTHPSKENPA